MDPVPPLAGAAAPSPRRSSSAGGERPVSVSRFSDPSVVGREDPARHPSKACAYWLRRDIVRGVFQPRERLKVEPLSRFYGVGQSPVREAILMVASTTLVAHEHLKGYRVADVSLADYRDVLDIYQRLYRLALDMAFQRGDDVWEERVVVQLHRSLRVSKALPDAGPERREMWQIAYNSLHRALISGCGSPVLIAQLDELGGRLERYVNLFADLERDRDRDNHAEHRDIVEALLSRDATRLRELIDRLFDTTEPMRETIKARLAALDPSGARA